MKKILILGLFLIALTCRQAIAVPDPVCYTHPCYDACNTECETWSEWGKFEREYVPPDFPQCTLNVQFCFRECQDKGSKTVQVYINGIWPTYETQFCGDCQNYYTYLKQGTTWDCARVNQRENLRIFRKITRELFEEWIVELEQNNYQLPFCNPYEPFDRDHMIFKVIASQGACHAFCISQYKVSDDPPLYEFYKSMIDCTPEPYCCCWFEGFCIDSKNTETRSDDEIIQVEDLHSNFPYPYACKDITPDDNLCPDDAYQQSISDCIDSCSEP